jgi:hypothetical protein
MAGEVEAEIQYEITSYSSTGAATLAWYFVPATRLVIDSVSIHFSAAPTDNTTIASIAYIPSDGYTYGATIWATTASVGGFGVTKDLFWQPVRPLLLKGPNADGIKISFANQWGVTYGVEIIAQSNQPS